MVRVSIPLSSILKTEEGTSSTDPRNYSKIFNGYVFNDGVEKCIVKRPGYTSFGSAMTATPVFHPYVDTAGNAYCVNSSNRKIVINGVEPGSALAAMSNLFLTNGITWAEDDTYIYIHGGNDRVAATSDYVLQKTYAGNVLIDTPTEITDADHPCRSSLFSPPGVVALDGYFFIIGSDGTDRKIYNSDLGDPTSWVSTNAIAASLEPDALFYLAKHKNHIVAFGSSSIEFFYDAGNPTGSPLARRNDIFYKVGIVSHALSAQDGAGNSGPENGSSTNTNGKSMVATYGDVLFFLGRPDGGTVGVYALHDFKLERISTPAIDRILTDSGMFNGSSGTCIKGIVTFNNKAFLVVDPDFSNNNAGMDPLIYDINENRWYQWDVDYIRGVYKNRICAADVTMRTVSGFQDGGADYDGPSIYTTKINQLPGVNVNTYNRLKVCNELSVRAGDRGTGTSTLLEVSYTDNDFLTFSTVRTLDMDKFGSRLTGLGAFYERAFLLNYIDGGATVQPKLYDLVLDIDVMNR